MQTYYQFYWNKIDEESIRILRIFGESEDVIVPETIGTTMQSWRRGITALRRRNTCRQNTSARSVFMTRRGKSGRKYRQMMQTGTHASWNLAVTG